MGGKSAGGSARREEAKGAAARRPFRGGKDDETDVSFPISSPLCYTLPELVLWSRLVDDNLFVCRRVLARGTSVAGTAGAAVARHASAEMRARRRRASRLPLPRIAVCPLTRFDISAFSLCRLDISALRGARGVSGRNSFRERCSIFINP